ncbi:SGNH/GDSL hydrolase family protein [Acidicapsa ligni]|uniref:SGNH/GDSL hydrolase family protein n=1 Tax=Acidicapsa ligni TaxID=542300 RepID=UPI0021DFC594|nr:SGNH/GDSL hydrolase family protein [Acidicapsa ligni]
MTLARAAAAALLVLNTYSATCQHRDWIATWTASPEAADPDPDDALLNLNDQTVRERARVSVGGRQVRIVLSNEYGSAPLMLGRVSVGIARNKAAVVSRSLRGVTFDGKDKISIAAGATATSDPVDLRVESDTELVVSLYIPEPVIGVTWHSLAMKQAAISKHGDHTRDTIVETNKTSDSSVFLKQVLVPSHPRLKVIVAFGDSIVDGDKSTPEEDNGWPHDLFKRLLASGDMHYSVVNEGIAGNRLLKDGPFASLGASGLSRFQRDALDVPGVTDIVLLEGTNDIGFPEAKLHDLLLAPAKDAPTAEDIIRAYRQIIAESHARGIRVIGCTIMPTEGAAIANYHTDTKEHTRQAINDWIRTSRAFDAVIDFDAVMRDPEQPIRLNPRFASDDHLHPNAMGYQKMADAIDLSLLRRGGRSIAADR